MAFTADRNLRPIHIRIFSDGQDTVTGSRSAWLNKKRIRIYCQKRLIRREIRIKPCVSAFALLFCGVLCVFGINQIRVRNSLRQFTGFFQNVLKESECVFFKNQIILPGGLIVISGNNSGNGFFIGFFKLRLNHIGGWSCRTTCSSCDRRGPVSPVRRKGSRRARGTPGSSWRSAR